MITSILQSTGISHEDETIFLFPMRERRFKTSFPTRDEEQVRKAMLQMWTDFARTGYEMSHKSNIILASTRQS